MRWQLRRGSCSLHVLGSSGHLPHHAFFDHGRTGGRMGRPGPQEHLRRDGKSGGDAVRSRCRRRRARFVAERRPDLDVYRVAGPAADDPQHVQNRRRAAAGRIPRFGPCAGRTVVVDLRRPPGRHGCPPDRFRHARHLVSAGSHGLGRHRPHRLAQGPRAVPPLLRRLPHLA